MASPLSLTESHNLLRETAFWSKSQVFVAKRRLVNLFSDIRRFRDTGKFQNASVIAVSESELWNPDDNEQNRILTAGKIQNLRIASRKLNGIEIDAGALFSFWRHIGAPSQRRGYVLGREIREGCVIATIAGGLCQLSNALYDAALKAGFEIIERHRHTRVIKGSLAEQDRDATVKWNYVDLRFRATYPFRMEIDITPDKLIVKFLCAEEPPIDINPSNILFQSSKLNDCFSCGNTACFKHPDPSVLRRWTSSTTYILDEHWPEYDTYIAAQATASDHYIVPLQQGGMIDARRYEWKTLNANTTATTAAAWQRALMSRLAGYTRSNVFEVSLRADRKVARAAARLIPVESTHVVVSQNLLPFLWETGTLGGRTFDVLMTRLPMETLHARLDQAHRRYRDSKTLNDFRASDHLVQVENIALTKARHIITPHHEIAELFRHKSTLLGWHTPEPKAKHTGGNKILFPASSLARKGAYEMKRLARELDLSVVISGHAVEQEGFWSGITISHSQSDPLHDIGLIIFPTYVEHQPRLLLRAIAGGIPVITTTATGLTPQMDTVVLPIGDYDALKAATIHALNHTMS